MEAKDYAATYAIVLHEDAAIRSLVVSALGGYDYRVDESREPQHALSLMKKTGACAGLFVGNPVLMGSTGFTFLAMECPDTQIILISESSDVDAINSETNNRWWVVWKQALPQAIGTALGKVRVPGGVRRPVILLAEDEPMLRSLIQEMLVRRGFSVLAAYDGEEALKISRTYAGSINLLLADVKMPQLSGPELANYLKVERPGTKVLIMSGYSSGVLEEYAETQDFIQKPFVAKDLVEKIRALMERAGVQAKPERY